MEVVAGRAHLKHTEGGDFRQTTYRAVRHGLMQSKSVLLEPFYHFEILVPDTNTGRVMSDVERMKENCAIDETKDRFTRLSVTVKASQNLHKEKASCNRMLFSFNHFSTGHEAGTA